MRQRFQSVLVTALAAVPLRAQTLRLPGGLSIAIDGIGGRLVERGSNEPLRIHGRLGAHDIVLVVHRVPIDRFFLGEPESLLELLRMTHRAPIGWRCSRYPFEPYAKELAHCIRDRGWTLDLGPARTWTGPYGGAPIAGFASGMTRDLKTSRVTGRLFVLSGLLPRQGYLVEAFCPPRGGDRLAERVEDFFRRSIRYRGPLRDPLWTEAEALERWRRSVPSSFPPRPRHLLRSRRFLVFTTGPKSRALLRALDRIHERTRKLLPFREVPGRRLMPVFLFRSHQEYEEFAAEYSSRPTLGFAKGDFCAAPYLGPRDPVLAHEVTHQILQNRLFTVGGGLWLQEGIAEYVALGGKTLRRRGRIRLPSRPTLSSLLRAWRFEFGDAKPGERVSPGYLYSGLFLAFLAEGPSSRGRLPDLVSRLGGFGPAEGGRIEATLTGLLGTTRDELERSWLAWCSSH